MRRKNKQKRGRKKGRLFEKIEKKKKREREIIKKERENRKKGEK